MVLAVLPVTTGKAAVVTGKVAVITGKVTGGHRQVTVVAGNGKVPSASPTDMLFLDSRFRGNDEP